MTRFRTIVAAGILVPVFVVASGLNCLTLPEPVGDLVDLRVTLRIINASGVEAVVESTFFNEAFTVRHTRRTLFADGPAADETVAGTITTRITVTARDASSNEILAQGELLNGRDFAFGETVEFTIGSGSPSPFPCPLVADAGPDQSVVPGDTVVLAGASAALDPSCPATLFDWHQIGGPVSVSISNADTENASFTAPPVSAETVFLFELTISDGATASASDSTQVTVSPDCNGNGVADADDVSAGAADCQGDGVPDVCQLEPDCNGNGVPDACDIAGPDDDDCDGNLIPDSCDITNDPGLDCNGNGRIDACELAEGSATDCNNNQTIDSCDIANCVKDPACRDCDGNGVPDGCDIAADPRLDCDRNASLDGCDPEAFDVEGFVQALLGRPDAEIPEFDCHFDANFDGLIDGNDIRPFVERLLH